MNHAPRLLLLVAATLSPACAATGSGDARTDPAAAGDPRSVPVFRGDGSTAAWSDLVDAAVDADAVILGENHGHPLGLAIAAALWSDVVERTPRAALSLEFFGRDEQCHLDDYLAGLTDEATFEQRTDRTAGSYPPGHRAMIEAAKAAGRPVFAANAPRPYVRLASSAGFDRLATLTAEQRRLFRVPDELPTGRYRHDFDEVMGDMAGHGGNPPAATASAATAPTATTGEPGAPVDPAAEEARHRAALDGAFRGQSLWDWTMAGSVDRALWDGNAPVVQVVGRMHCDFHGGLVLALDRLHPGIHTVTVSFVDEAPTAFQDADAGRADFVIYVGPEPTE